MSLRQVRLAAEHALEQAGIESAAFESRILLEQVLGRSLFLADVSLTQAQANELQELIQRRCAGEPLQYLCGEWEFYGLSFAVGSGVLIPRQDTETLVDTVLSLRAGTPCTRLLDLCSGSGCIPAAIAAHLPHVTGDCVELSEQALPYLRQNLKRHAPQMAVCAQDACLPCAALAEKRYDVITANPPYLTEDDMQHLQREVTYEPEMALYGGVDGLDFYRKLISLWRPHLAKGGVMLFEVGAGQASEVLELMKRADLESCNSVCDLTGIPRVVVGYARA